MRYVSLFSGIEAASVAWKDLGWEPVAFSEVDPFCCKLLAERFPEVPNLGDIREIKWKEQDLGAVDLVVGGSPCQSFSIAGGREGLDGESRLMLEYIRAVDEIHPRWLLWENVPGVFSIDEGRAFGLLLDELEKLGYGLAWRVLDAQFFGVAQRRRRVFLVGCAGGGVGTAAAVLFEPESVRGNTQTSSEKRQELARSVGRDAGEESDRCLTPWDVQSKRIYSANGTAPTLPSGTNEGMSIQPIVMAGDAAGAEVSEGFSPTLTAHNAAGAPILFEQPVAFAQNTRDEVRIQGDGTIAGALSAQPGMKQTTDVVQTANTTRNGLGVIEDAAYTLDTNSTQAVIEEVDAWHTSSRSEQVDLGGGKGALVGEEVAFTLLTGGDQTLVHEYMVRRLTPTECERLQGFPDGWTDLGSDSKRYKALGNSMAVPVMRWIGERIEYVEGVMDELERNGEAGA